MLGQMQDWPLTVGRILSHAARNHGRREIVSAAPDGSVERSDWGTLADRAHRLAAALNRRGIAGGARLATLAFNSARHVECWYGIAAIGAIYHTLNPRLHPDQIVWIANNAGDDVLFFDPMLADLVRAIAPALKTVRLYVALGREVPEGLPEAVAYESLIAEPPGDFVPPEIDENSACGLCYTSGTTGDPKGVLYSHRSNVLHAMVAATADIIGLCERDSVLPVVPMFHANGWVIPFAAALTGARLVMPGPRLDPPSLAKLLITEKVTLSAAVPTVWLGLLQYLDDTGLRLPHLKMVVIGGAACPRSMIERFEKTYGVEVRHGWGMTETSPIGTVNTVKASAATLSEEALFELKARQGRPPFTVEIEIVDAANAPLPHDGVTMGRLKVRGPAVAKRYFGGEDAVDAQGWFDTGDIATIDADGILTITDRAKDVIKSGGEWISTVALENLAMAHPAVAEAAVIGVPHPKWDERPLLVVALKPGQAADKRDILGALTGKIAKWWMPDDVVFVDALPHSATGKVQKVVLRQRYAGQRD